MLKNILNLKGAQQLSKNEQQSINGGGARLCPSEEDTCPGCAYECVEYFPYHCFFCVDPHNA